MSGKDEEVGGGEDLDKFCGFPDLNSQRPHNLDVEAEYEPDPRIEKIKGHQYVYTEAKTKEGDPLAYGSFLDFSLLPDDEDDKMKILWKTLNERGLKPPFLVMDLSAPKDLKLILNGVPYQGKNPNEVKPIRIVMSCSEVVDMSNFATSGNSRVLVHREIPTYRWFHAMNIQLKELGNGLRVVPFPIETTYEEGAKRHGDVFFEAMPCTEKEYALFESVLHAMLHGNTNVVDVPGAFKESAKMAYQLLFDRGLKGQLTEKQVDRFLSHVLISKKPNMHGVFIENWEEGDFVPGKTFGIYA